MHCMDHVFHHIPLYPWWPWVKLLGTGINLIIQYNLDYLNPFGQAQKSLGSDRQKSLDITEKRLI